jgi:tetratricopeptide (TPR) repeat protein
MLRQGLQAARRAIAIDPRLPEAHKAESLVLRGLRDTQAATAALQRALEVNPRFTPAMSNLAVYLFEEGNIAGAERLHRKILQVDPQDPFAMLWLAQVLDGTDRFEEVLRVSAELARINTNPFYANGAAAMGALAYMGLGRDEEARAMVERLRSSSAQSGNIDLMQAVVSFRAGDRARAGELIDRAEASPQLAPVLIYRGASIAVALGQKDRARRLIARTITRPQGPVRIRITPGLWPLADEPPFAPRRSEMTLVWPAEAPPPAAGTEELFAAVRYESGLP